MEPVAEHPGYYRDPKAREFLYNAGGQMVDEPQCWKCSDIGLLRIAPLGRPSVGAWDSDYMVCECREAAREEKR